MRIRRRRLRDGLVATGCLVADVDLVAPSGSVDGFLRLAVAGAFLLAGSLLHVWSKGCLEQNQKLVTAGPYRFTRNPFYLANGLVDLGLCALIGRLWVALPYAVLWGLAYRDTIRREESRLAELFPGAFERYAAAVPRLLPTGRHLSASEATGGFTLDNPALAQGGEYARILGFWIAAATIVAWVWIRAHRLAVFAPGQTMGLGFVVLVAVAWVWKLALAEVFRRPEVALLPDRDVPARRRLVTFALVAALYFAARGLGAGSAEPRADAALPSVTSTMATAATIAFVAMIGAVALLPRVGELPARRAVLHAALALAMVVFAAGHGILWLGSAGVLWAGLAGLDDFALGRVDGPGGGGEGDGDGDGDRAVNGAPSRVWSAFGPIAFGTILSVGLLALLRAWASA